MTGKITLLAAAMIAAMAATASGAASVTPQPRLAYVTGNGGSDAIWLANADGTRPQRLGPGDDPLIAPNGQSVAAASFAATGPALTIYTVGGQARHYLDVRKQTITAASWSPDSRYLSVEVFGADINGNVSQSGVAVVDTTTNRLKMVTTKYPCGASFAPSAPDRLAYASSPLSSFCLSGKVNVFTVNADGSGSKQLTSDGRSLNPAWGPTSIAFDRETTRHKDAPVFQIWAMNPDGSHRVQVTRIEIPKLVDGLVPLQYSANGQHLLTRYEGQDTTGTWAVDLARHRVYELKVKGRSVVPGGISLDGLAVLVDDGQFMNTPSHGIVKAVPFAGGPATTLVSHAAAPSWNR